MLGYGLAFASVEGDELSLSEDLEQAHKAFRDAHYALKAFVHDSKRGVASALEMAASTQERFAIHLRGDVPPPPPGVPESELVQVELSLEQLEVVADLWDRHVALIEARYPTMLLEMALIYLMALFDAFVADSYTAVLVARPEKLKSKKQLSYEVALSFEDRESMIRHMASREINEIGYKSLRDQIAYYEDHFDVDLRHSDEFSVEQLVEISARRNLLVHNNGVVNGIYVTLVPGTTTRLGERINSDDSYWEDACAVIDSAAAETRRLLLEKFA